MIRVEKLGKRYMIGGKAEPYSTLRESLIKAVKKPFRSLGGGSKNERRQFWALKDVGFEVRPGEVVGIIGRNGAGKSTLLKILSRITEPTRGRVELYGNVGSLLEVGTGFHPELTGRENIYLNGAILGMKRSEITAKFDEIVDFAEVVEFLDTPVKHYSAGMYVRLAFAVAANLNSEVLIVDEVLAVGDAQFQKKCLKKMEEVGHVGRTVLFVSHDMQAMGHLCDRIIWLAGGTMMGDGKAQHDIGSYLMAQNDQEAERSWEDAESAPGNDIVRLRRIRVRNASGETMPTANITEPVHVEMTYDVLKPEVLAPNLHFFNDRGVCLFVTVDVEQRWKRTPRPVGTYTSSVTIPGNFLSEGSVFVRAAITTFSPFWVHLDESDVVMFQVVETGGEDTARGDYTGYLPGAVRPLLDWTTTES